MNSLTTFRVLLNLLNLLKIERVFDFYVWKNVISAKGQFAQVVVYNTFSLKTLKLYPYNSFDSEKADTIT